MRKSNIEDIYLLSPLQEGLLFHSLSSRESDDYLQHLRFDIRGRLDGPAFERAWQKVVARHAILRTAFVWDKHERPLQAVRRQVRLPWSELDWRGLAPERRQEQLASLLKADRSKGFDLSKAPLLRVTVVRTSDEDCVVVCTLHHLLTDGWSTSILIREVFAFYNAEVEGRELSLESPRPYRDYIEWLQRQDMVEAELFWRETLRGFAAPTPLITDRSAAGRPESGDTVEIQRTWLGASTTERLQALARRQGVTLNTLVMGAWALLLGRYVGEQDVVFGVTVSGRPATLAGVERMVGPFINTLPMRVQMPPDAPLLPWLRGLQSRLLEICEYDYSPLVRVQGFGEVARGVPLFESMVVFENYPFDSVARELSAHLESVNIHSLESSSYPLGLVAAPGPKLFLQIGYDPRRFSFDTVTRMLGHLEAVLEGMSAPPAARLSDLSLLTEAERHQLLVAWNETGDGGEPDSCLHHLFEEQVGRTPEAVAVAFEGEQLTYRELDERAGRLAAFLAARGVGPEARVGVCLDRSPEMIVALVGVLKAGAAYVPIDPAYPAERRDYIVDDARVSLLLTRRRFLDSLAEAGREVVCLDSQWDAVAAHDPAARPAPVSGDNLAYVIYTSGSTGKPKGVMMPHKGICNTLLWRRESFSLSDSDRILQNLSFAFDASVWQIFGALLSGGRLVLASPERHRDTDYLIETIIEQGITVTDFPPSMLMALLGEAGVERCGSLRHVFCGGEAMSHELQERFFARLGAELHNVYGPTETAVDATCWTCQRKESRQVVPIGRPITNKRIYILDSELQPVPVGVMGELCIGGAGMARGYVGRAAATAEKFIPDPFSSLPGSRLYKTGDLARFLPDGHVEFSGRADSQVKVRGHRVELGEVEAALSQHPGVEQAAAAAPEDGAGGRRLVAYAVAREGSGVTAAGLREHLSGRLPGYMVPSAVVLLDALPLTPGGKVDRSRLPAPETKPDESNYAPPQTRAEKLLCAIWEKVLRAERVGVHDNFFELGGDSILGIQVSARAREMGLHVTPRHLFEHQTVAQLAAVAAEGKRVTAEQGLVTGPAPLTPIQHEFFEWGLENPHHYYQAVLLELAPEVDSSLLERAAGELLVQHDALRLRFESTPEGRRQVFSGLAAETHYSREDLSGVADGELRAALEADAGRVSATLHVERGPLFRAVEYDLGAGRGRRLLLVIHHLGVDGVSWRILLEDMQRAYEQLREGGVVRLPAKTTSFKAWAERLSEYGRGEELRREIPYWLAEEREKAAPLPVDHAGGDNNVNSARTITLSLSAEETGALLHEVPAVYHTQINDLLLTGLLKTFERWTGERALLVALEGHGREDLFDDINLSRTVGWFTTVFPVLLQSTEAGHAGKTLQSVKEQLRRIPNRGIGAGLLRYLSGDERVAECLRALPPAEVSFNYLGQFDQVLSSRGPFSVASELGGHTAESEGRRKHLLDVVGTIFDGRLRLSWTYSENLHRRETVEKLAAWYAESLRELIAHCQSPEAGGHTPSDFPLAGLDQQTLDEFVGRGPGVADIYPLSPMQEGLLFHSLYAPESKVYFLQASWRVESALDVTAFLRAWQTVVERHAILRTTFLWEGLSRPLQVVREGVGLEWAEEDWRGLGAAEQSARWEEFLLRDRERGFDLSAGPLMRLTLARTGEDAYNFAWSTHHVLLDGWSNQFLLREVFALYDAYRRGRELQLRPPHQYRDYIAWLQRQDLKKAEAFWREELAGFTEPTRLSIDRRQEGAGEQEQGFEEQQVELGAEATEAVESLARAHKVTLNTAVQGAWGLVLSRYGGSGDVVFGATSSGRAAGPKGIEMMVGLFINTLPVRVRVNPEESVGGFLTRLQARQSEAQEFEYSPLLQVQGWSEVARGTAMFDSILVFENYQTNAQTQEGGGASLRVSEARGFEHTHYPLTLTAVPGKRLLLKLEYECARFEREAMSRLLAHLKAALEGMARGPARRLKELSLLSEEERRQLLVEWNPAAEATAPGRCVHELFEEQAERTPDATALMYAGERLSYRELNRRANRLAHHLRRRGARPEVVVGLCLERSAETLVGLLAILKSGAAYLPLDPSYPRERLAYLMEDARVGVLVTREGPVPRLPETGAAVVLLDGDREAIEREAEDNPRASATPDNLAYVIYTSGSTGRPKGVAVAHGPAASHLSAVRDAFGYSGDDRVLQFPSFNFDVSLEVALAPLAGGSALVLKGEEAWGTADIIRATREAGLTVADVPPSYLSELTGDEGEGRSLPASIRLVTSGGEAMPTDAARRWRRTAGRHARLVNAYGPTEAVITATTFTVPDDFGDEDAPARVPIGRPLPGRTAYILDRHGHPVPVGVWGELHLGGSLLARGYVGRAAATAEKFIPDPFSALPGSRLYRTGDLARFLPDGHVEFSGRADSQVKVRGHRVELGEVEAVLSQHPGVEQAAAAAPEDGAGGRRLVAYAVAREGSGVTAAGLREHLSGRLPGYMVPSAVVLLDALPLTPGGKLDRSRLPAPGGERPEVGGGYVAPRDFVEIMLIGIWEEVLGVKPVGVKDDFFELGGHSILALRLMGEVHKQFGRELPLAVLFEKRTVEQLAEVLRRRFDTLPDSPLVPIQPLGTKRPLFFVHVGSGQVLCYLELARHLGTDQPFYGLQDTNRYDAEGGAVKDVPVEEMAAYYVEALRLVQPEGPYYVGGWSFGGLVAYEMALQLRARGEEVALLILLDTVAPQVIRAMVEDDAALLGILAREMGLPVSDGDLLPLSAEDRLLHVVEHMKKAHLLFEDPRAFLKRQLEIFKSRIRVIHDYYPKTYGGRILFFSASVSDAETEAKRLASDTADDPTRGFGSLSAGSLELYTIPGSHTEIARGPGARLLAEMLSSRLDREARVEPELNLSPSAVEG